MNTSHEKERLKKTTIIYVVVMVLIVVLILLAVQDSQVKTIAVILVLLVGAAAIIVQWLLFGKKGEATKMQEPAKPVQKASQPEKTCPESYSSRTSQGGKERGSTTREPFYPNRVPVRNRWSLSLLRTS